MNVEMHRVRFKSSKVYFFLSKPGWDEGVFVKANFTLTRFAPCVDGPPQVSLCFCYLCCFQFVHFDIKWQLMNEIYAQFSPY